ncbi:PRMT5-domain-containing protein [Armillaria gallica]|uniref:PRMT5-domain-containing protein n=1 Tax=Armillaria gallica TaxID=47427 RepID=A0A2H3E8D5_ARMGA|nr:PRMT5-domain-containing protein [Armillaria gallica]
MSVCLLTTTGDTDEGGCVQLTTDVWHTRWKWMFTGAGDSSSECPAFEPADLLPSSPPPTCRVLLSPWLQLDAHDAGVQHDTGIALRQEVAHCTFLNLTSAILPVPHLAHTPSYARAMYAALSSSSLLRLATLCEYHPRLSLALDLTPPLPTLLPPITEAYAAEPISHVMISAHSFISNAKGYPVLPKTTQSSGEERRICSEGREREVYARGYGDYLQAPLQLLQDNLQNATYETFEQDPVKYANYEEAIYRALVDRVACSVSGSGRSPLITRALAALERASRKSYTLYAIEKNRSAYLLLQQTFPDVQLLFGDMRSVKMPEKVDIVISELLGSYGDNKLSPECLDGVERWMKPSAISIPSSYTAHLSPLSSSKLYNEARNTSGAGMGGEITYVVMFQAVRRLSPTVADCWGFEHPRFEEEGPKKGDTRMSKRYTLSAMNPTPLEPPKDNGHNVRRAEMVFDFPEEGVLHGLFYIEGSITICIGVMSMRLFPDYPHNTRWMSPQEQRLAQARIAEGAGEADWDNKEDSPLHGLKLVLKHPVLFPYARVLSRCRMRLTMGRLTETLGFSTMVSLLLCAPPRVFSAIVCCLNAWHADRTGEQLFHISGWWWGVIVGLIMGLSTMRIGAWYASLFLMACSQAIQLQGSRSLSACILPDPADSALIPPALPLTVHDGCYKIKKSEQRSNEIQTTNKPVNLGGPLLSTKSPSQSKTKVLQENVTMRALRIAVFPTSLSAASHASTIRSLIGDNRHAPSQCYGKSRTSSETVQPGSRELVGEGVLREDFRAPDPLQPLTLQIMTQRFIVQRRMSKRVVDRDHLDRGAMLEARLDLAATTTLSTACTEVRGARSDGYGVQDGCTAVQMAGEGTTSLLPPRPKPILEPTANSKPPDYHQVYASLVFGIMPLHHLFWPYDHLRAHTFVVDIGGPNGGICFFSRISLTLNIVAGILPTTPLHNGMWDDATIPLIRLPNPTVET